MPRSFLTLTILPDEFAICRLEAADPPPIWAFQGGFYSVTRTPDELSIVCEAKYVPADIKHERGWRLMKFEGPLDLEVVGVIAAVANPLAEAGVAIFPLATYGTDYILI